jgi:hypothetical protein
MHVQFIVCDYDRTLSAWQHVLNKLQTGCTSRPKQPLLANVQGNTPSPCREHGQNRQESAGHWPRTQLIYHRQWTI